MGGLIGRGVEIAGDAFLPHLGSEPHQGLGRKERLEKERRRRCDGELEGSVEWWGGNTKCMIHTAFVFVSVRRTAYSGGES